MDLATPFDATELVALLRSQGFWCVALVATVPLFLGTIERREYFLPLMRIFFSLLWAYLLNTALIRQKGRWGTSLLSMSFTGFIGVPLLALSYVHVFSPSFAGLPDNKDLGLSLLGYVSFTGLTEEFCKIVPVLLYVAFFRQKAPFSAIVSVGIFSGLGFAAVENDLYGHAAWNDVVAGIIRDIALSEGQAHGKQEFLSGAGLMMLRIVSCAFLHGVWTGLYATFVAYGLHGKAGILKCCLIGLAISAVLHGVYDWLLGLQPTVATMIAGASVLMFYGYYGRLAMRDTPAAETSPESLTALAT